MWTDFKLFQVSREIITRCQNKISLEDVFEGQVEKSRNVLEDCIECCKNWKSTYEKISKVHNHFSDEEWLLDESSIFAQVRV